MVFTRFNCSLCFNIVLFLNLAIVIIIIIVIIITTAIIVIIVIIVIIIIIIYLFKELKKIIQFLLFSVFFLLNFTNG